MSESSPSVHIERLLRPNRIRQHALDELRDHLGRTPRSLPSRHFYDDRGAALFDAITRLDVYYPTRAEAGLLADVADRVAESVRADELVELGPGSGGKTRLLLDAMRRAGGGRRYVPIDVSEAFVRQVAENLLADDPTLEIHGMVADFVVDLGHLPPAERRLVAFLGGTIGNLDPDDDGVAFLRRLRTVLDDDDRLLLGTDLIKSAPIIEAAYNDAEGVTAAFNRNILSVINTRFDANFRPEAYRHHAFYEPEHRRIEMHLRPIAPQSVRVGALGLDFTLAAGEPLRTEISTKFDRPRVERLLTSAGFALTDWFTDAEARFALSLARPLRA